MRNAKTIRAIKAALSSGKGFTLMELVIAMAISGVVLAGIYATHDIQQKTYRNQSMVVNTQQNVRGAMYIMQKELLMAGYDRTNSGRFGLEHILPISGFSAIEFTGDFGPGGNRDNGTVDSGERIAYSLFNSPLTPDTGITDLGRQVDGGTRQLLAEGIEALGLAYAFDSDGDGELDQDVNGNVIWAVDSDGDDQLDRSLDNNDSDASNGVALATVVPMEDIRAVRIWLLARTKGPAFKPTETRTYVVGPRHPFTNDGYERRLLMSTIMMRNIGL